MGRARPSVVVLAVVAILVSSGCAGVFTHARDTSRTAWYSDEKVLTPQLVGGGTFGQMFETAVDGQVYAQPVIAADTVLVVTERNNIYGIDHITGERKWSRNVGVPWNASDIACADLAPWVGITGTPVIDANTKTAYFFKKTYASGTSGPAAYFAHAVDVTTGAERPGFPVRIQGTAQNIPGKVFNPTTSLQRPGLLLLDGVVYAAFGGHCDRQPYSGWVVGVTTAGAISTMWTPAPGDRGAAGIWHSGGGLASDGPGSIYLASGNGSSDVTPRPGTNPGQKLGQAVVHLRVQPDRSLRAVDFYSPYDADWLDTWDGDLGSGTPVLLPPNPFSTPAHPRILAIIGKQGYLHLLDPADLGGMRQGPSGGDRVVARLGPYGSVWGQTAVWPGDGGYLYVQSTWYGEENKVRALKWAVDAGGQPRLVEVGQSNETGGFGSTAAVVSSNGTASGSALLWTIARDNAANGQLRAYDTVPVNGQLRLRWSGSLGKATKFSIPAIFGDRVYVGTQDGRLLSFGSPVARPLLGGPHAIPDTTVGQQRTANLTLRATSDLGISAIRTSGGGFTVGAPTVSDPPQHGLPVLVPVGETVTVPVTYRPTSAGPASGEIILTTSIRDVSIPVTSFGINPTGLLRATPPLISFGGAAVGGIPVNISASIANVGATEVRVNSITLPGAAFSFSGLPAPGGAIAARTNVVVTGTFTPTTLGSFEDVLTLHTSAGDLELPLSGTAAPPPVMSLSPTTVSFGSTLVGSTRERTFTVTNTGGSPLSITKSKPPGAGTGFVATSSVPEASVIPPGQSRTQTVTFTPSATGNRSDTWVLNGNDGGGERAVTFTGTGASGTTVGGPPGSGWSANGTAALAEGPALELTGLAIDGRGSSFAPNPITSSSVVVSFRGAMGFGTGADGMALVFGDVARGASAASLGAPGGGLGFAGIPGFAVGIDSYQNPGDPSSNSIGLTDGPVGADYNSLRWLATTSSVPPLRAAHDYVVSVVGGYLVVRVDGVVVLTKSGVTLPTTFRLGFSGGSGRLTDIHRVSNVSIRYGG